MLTWLCNIVWEDQSVPTCSEVLCTGVVVAREVGEATVVTMQGSCFRVVSRRDSALMNWGCSSTWPIKGQKDALKDNPIKDEVAPMFSSTKMHTHLQVLAVHGVRWFELVGLQKWPAEEKWWSAPGSESGWPLAEQWRVRMTSSALVGRHHPDWQLENKCVRQWLIQP